MMPTYWLHLHNFGTDNAQNTVPLDAYDQLRDLLHGNEHALQLIPGDARHCIEC